jgi:hypothetical protein
VNRSSDQPGISTGRLRHLSLLLVVGSVVSVVIAAESDRDPFTKGPYLQAPGSSTMTVMWESPTNKPGTIFYGTGGALGTHLELERPRPLLVVTNYSVTNVTAQATTNVTKVSLTNIVFLYAGTLTNLQPDTVYSYVAETGGARTSAKAFKTFGVTPNKVRFLAYGDSRSNPKLHAVVASSFKSYAPDFILHLGDLVAEGKQYHLWSKEFFEPLADVIDEVPILPVIGNHEEDGTNYLNYTHLPGAQRWYSYDVGPVHVLALDFHFEKASEAQFAFARQDLLQAHAPWKIVMLHYPVFNVGGHGTAWGQTNYLPLFHQARVDLVIGGHSHIYERFHPIASPHSPDAWPITFVTSGGGGAPLATAYPHPALAAHSATNHFVLFEATASRLAGFAITTNNAVIDSFELRKSGGYPPSSYYRQVYPESTLKLSFQAPSSLAGTLADVPTTNSLVALNLNLHPLRNGEQAFPMKISLTPASALNYELPDGPFEATTPTLPQTNQTVSVWIRATGQKKITTTGKEKELSPPLIFQAEIHDGSVTTMAYGLNSKVTK